MLDFIGVQAGASASFLTVLYTLLMAFVLGILIALTYDRTFRGLSYSRGFVQAMVIAPIVAAMVIQAIGDSVARGLGMLAAMAIIRFRTSFKDPRDIIFMFASIGIGIACGLYGYTIAVVGCGVFCIACIILYFVPFVRSTQFDGMLRFHLGTEEKDRRELEQTLQKHCRVFALITLRDLQQSERLEYAYHVKLRDSARSDSFLQDLKLITSMKNTSLMLQETTVEL